MPRLVNQVAKYNLGGYDFPKTETWKYLPGTLDFPDSSVGKESACNAGDPGSIPGSERSAGEGIGYPLQYSRASLVAQLVNNPPAVQEAWFHPWAGKMPWRRERLPIPVFWLGEFHGYRPWGCHESDMTEGPSLSLSGYYTLEIFQDVRNIEKKNVASIKDLML